MQAIILAAGMGSRLKELTQNNTKCMVKVNGVTLIDRMLHQIEQQRVSRIIIVVGYEGQKLINYINTLDIQTPIVFIDNPIYDKTNNIYSLALAKEWLCKEDTLLFESDLIFEDSVLEALVTDARTTLALVDKYEAWMDGTCVKLAADDTIEAFVPGKKFNFEERQYYYKTVNLYKFSRHFSETCYVPFLEAYQSALGYNEYYEQVLRVITMLDDTEIKAKRLSGQKWYEIDDVQDLDIAESLFAKDTDERVERIQNRQGGYWRYPKLIDFCYPANPYFPSEKMKEEIKASFDKLLTEYPSGTHVNSLLAAKIFGIHEENIIVGNGTTELLKGLMGCLDGRVGVMRPMIEEYSNLCCADRIVEFEYKNKDYSYTADGIIKYFGDKNIKNLVIINPDDISGNYILKSEIYGLLEWAAEHEIRIILDESLSDFVDKEKNSFIGQNILSSNKHLYIMKNISQAHGVPGLRISILASGDLEMINVMKKDAARWNINSFGEFYMQIEEKYKKDYAAALVKLKAERMRLQDELAKVKGLRVISSQSNFVMVEVEEGLSSKELLKRLLLKYNLLVKDLSAETKGKNFIRIAIRSTEDNNILIASLMKELGVE